MTSRAGLYVTLAGLVTVVLCGVPALQLMTSFGWGNLFFTADDLIVTLLVLGSLGLVAVAVGLVITGSGGGSSPAASPPPALWRVWPPSAPRCCSGSSSP